MVKENIDIKNKKNLINNFSLQYILYALLILFIYVFIVNAWVGDDAYITFRTVDNFVNGYGLTWNTIERVQAYTHPLWMFIHSFFYFITGNIYYTTIFLSFAFSFAAFYLLIFKVAANQMNAIAGAVTLISSKIFIDYTSSGLENPLTYFLIIIFLIYYLKDDEAKSKIFQLSLFTALAMLNRMDTVLLFLPAIIYIVAKNWKVKHLLYMFYGFIPFILWEIFSIIYYGFPFPNTYYAKLNTGIPLSEYISQGISYYANLFQNDIMSGVVIFGGIIGIIIYSIKRKTVNIYLPLVLGICLYLLYILRIGGDFMSGRFFTGPFFMIVAVLATMKFVFKINRKSILVYSSIIIFFVVISGFTSYHPVITGIGFGSKDGVAYTFEEKDKVFRSKAGIEDERGIYYPETGLIPLLKMRTTDPTMPFVEQGKGTRESKYRTIVQSMIGMIGFYSGPRIHIIDFFGLADPLLSRLEVSKNPDWKGRWRIGHFYRRIPLGYIKTIETGQNQIKDKKLIDFYDKLKIITQKEIFSPERFSEILKFIIGDYNDLLQSSYRENALPKLFAGDENSVMIYYLRTANYYYRINEYRFALNNYRELVDNEEWIKEAVIRGEIYEKVLRLYMNFKQIDSAVFYVEKGLQYTQNQGQTISYTIFLSRHYKSLNELEIAHKILKDFLLTNPDEIPILNELANLFVLMNERSLAIELWEKILEIDPYMEDIYYDVYTYFIENKQFEKAAYYAFRAVESGEKVEQKILDELKKYRK